MVFAIRAINKCASQSGWKVENRISLRDGGRPACWRSRLSMNFCRLHGILPICPSSYLVSMPRWNVSQLRPARLNLRGDNELGLTREPNGGSLVRGRATEAATRCVFFVRRRRPFVSVSTGASSLWSVSDYRHHWSIHGGSRPRARQTSIAE